MSLMKIVPLIAAATEGEQLSREAALHDFAVLLEAQLGAIRYEAQRLTDANHDIIHNAVAQQRASRALYHLIYELQQRVDRMEGTKAGVPVI